MRPDISPTIVQMVMQLANRDGNCSTCNLYRHEPAPKVITGVASVLVPYTPTCTCKTWLCNFWLPPESSTDSMRLQLAGL